MDKQIAKVFPTLVNGYTLQSVKDNLDAIIENINKAKEENDKPWYAKKNVATAYIILGIVTLPFLIGFLILPLGIYARNKNKQ